MAASITENITFSVSVNIISTAGEEKVTSVVKNAIRKFRKIDTWFDVFDITTEGIEIDENVVENFEKNAKVIVSSKPSDCQVFNADPYDMIKILTEFDSSLKYVTINVKNDVPVEAGPGEPMLCEPANAFDVLMSGSHERKKPPMLQLDKPRFTAKDKLYNDFVENEDVRYPASLAAGEMTRQTMTIVDTLWYLDGSHDKINARITDSSKKIPARFAKYTGYNEFKRKRKAAPQITSAQLNRHADVLFRLSTSSTARAWGDFAQQLQGLAISLQTYAAYLENSNDKQKFRQSLSHPVRQYGDYGTVLYHPKCHGPVKPCYGKLDQVISECDEYTPVFFDEHLHTSKIFKDKFQRRRFLDGISLTYSVDVLSYDPGAGLGKVVFLWRVPEDRSPTEMMSSAAKVHQTLEDKLPQYHTREMRREFTRTYQGMANIPPHILRAIYSDLTLDATSAQNPALDARIRCAISSDDPDIAIDLRACNKGRPNETFDVFFEEIQKEVDSMTATDERRHGDIQHFSKFISVRDLIEQTSKKCPEGTPIPSESTVLFAFVPKNAYRNTSKLYKGRIQLQHKVQSRQLRSEHIDEHYCAAIFKYMKQYAVKYRDQTDMVCMDDKSKVDFGEPGMAISSGVRGKKSIVPVGCTLAALDHDLGSKGSLTPSVCLHIDIPENVSDSFYRGQVHVTLKDSVFQPSTPFRHATELQQILKPETDDEPHPYLLLFTDGGPDHRVTYGAVKCSLIILFKQLNLDILIAARTAPGHSWLNPAERIMSLLNIAFQNVALHRAEMNSMFEQMLRACSTMNEIRKKAEKEDGLEPAWLKAVEPMIIQLKERIERVQLKGKTFTSGAPATKQQVVDYESKVLRLVDPEITVGQYTKNHLKNKEMYNDYIERHCRERNYIFQVRKCNVETCCAPIRNPSGVVPPFLPDPELNPEDEGHYKSFMDQLGTETTERAMPSGQTASAAKVAEEQQGCPNRFLVAQNVRMTVKCYECDKPRCIYSKKALTVREERGLRRLLDRYQYTCGSIITPDGDCMQGVVFVRLQLCCQSPVEVPYYSSVHVAGLKDLCCYCGEPGADRDVDALQTHRVVLPICKPCKDSGRPIIKRLPRKN